MNKELVDLKEHLTRLEILSDIYNGQAKSNTSKKERDLAVLKMELVKKEMLLLCYLINKDIEVI